MKKIIVSLMLVLAMLLPLSLCSCDKKAGDVVNVTLKVVAEGETLCEEKLAVSAEKTEDGALRANIIKVIETAMDKTDYTIALSDKEDELTNFEGYYTTEEEGSKYYWEFTVNGEEIKSGNATNNYVKEGDTVEYTFFMMAKGADGKYESSIYDGSSDLFPGEPEVEEEAAE